MGVAVKAEEVLSVADGRVCPSHDGFVKWMERVEGKIERLGEAILGNGKPGLNERVRLLEESRRRDAEEEAREEQRLTLEAAKRENRALTAVRVLAPWVVAAGMGLAALLK